MLDLVITIIGQLLKLPTILIVIIAIALIFLAIIGKIPWGNPFDLTQLQRIGLAIFGVFLIVSIPIAAPCIASGCPPPPPSPTPQCSSNLIACSYSVVAISVPGQSSSSVMLDPTHSIIQQFTFNNTEAGTGLAFLFHPPLAVTPYHFVEIRGTSSTQPFSFEIQYKMKNKDKLLIVSSFQAFPVGTKPLIRVPIMAFDSSVNEIDINIPTIGQTSQVSIKSIQLR